MSMAGSSIYSATYSNVPIYEFNIEGNHVMRRRSDDWINATHILKVAEYDKPTRTRILEREVQKNVHEKVQGGYGKYQGTWIPLHDGRELAAKNGVLEKLLPIFDFVPGDRSPPPAPKHATAASRPRAPKAPIQRKPQPPGESGRGNSKGHSSGLIRERQVYHPPPPPPPPPRDYDRMDLGVHDIGTPDDESVIASESAFDDFDSAHFTGPHKRRRVEDHMSQADREHQLWAEELLDYFMLQEGGDALPQAPDPPLAANLNRPIDERGHTALHWAAAMADVEVVKTLINRGASIDAQSKNGETPLMRSVLFTNSYDKKNMEKLASMLIRTVNMQEWSGCTVFHHIAGITHSKKKYDCARYYMDCILNKMAEVLSPAQIESVLNEQDQNGDTAITIAARNGARKCVRSLIGRNAAVDIPNNARETADHLIVQLNHRRRERSHHRDLSSSPFQADPALSQTNGAHVQHSSRHIPFDPLQPHSLLSSSMAGQSNDVYKSQAAASLTSYIMPMLMEKARSLARSIDTEIADKDAELAEAERVVAMRRAEREQLQREQEKLQALEQEQVAGRLETDQRAIEELEQVEQDCARMTEEQQNAALYELLSSHEHISSGMPDDDVKMNGDTSSLTDMKLQIAREIVQSRASRNKLILELVQHLSMAGFGKRQEEFKKLITGALLVRDDEVETLLPAIMSELEDARGLDQIGA